MKKVFLCVTKSNWGGAQKYVFDLAVSLPKTDFDVSVLAGGSGELFKKLQENNIKIIPLKHSRRDINIFRDTALFFELLQIFRKERPDIVHLNSSKVGVLGVLSARLAKIKKVVFTAHGWAFNEDRNIFSKAFLWASQMKTVLFSHTTICASKAVQDQLPKILKRKTVVIYNGIGQIKFLEKNTSRKIVFDKIRSGKNLGESLLDKRWVGTIAELHKNKGLGYAVEAFANIKDGTILVIIGEGEERKKLERQIGKLGLEGIVFLAGKIDNASTLLKAFDIFLLPSITEALPYSILEAGMAGLPTIATKVGGLPEIIENEVSGLLIQPRSEKEVLGALSKLINGSDTTDFGVSLRGVIESKFYSDTMVTKTIDIYQK